MSDLRRSTRASGGGRFESSKEFEETSAEAHRQEDYKRVAEAVVRLKRTFPAITTCNAKAVLAKTDFDVTKAIAMLNKEQLIVLEVELEPKLDDPSEKRVSPTKNGGTSIRDEGRASNSEPAKPVLLSVQHGPMAAVRDGGRVEADEPSKPAVISAGPGSNGEATDDRVDDGDSIKSGTALRSRLGSGIGPEVNANRDKRPKPGANQVHRPRKALKRKAPDLSDADQDIVEISLEVGAQKYKVFASYISYYCPGLEEAADKDTGFVRYEDQPIPAFMTLKNVSPSVFRVFLNWLYRQKITDPKDRLPSTVCLVQLWVFGNRVRAPGLQNLAIKGLEGKAFCPGPIGMKHIYDQTSPGDALRRYFIDSVICRILPTQALFHILAKDWERIPQECLKDSTIALKTIASTAAAGIKLRALKIEDYLVPEAADVDD